MNSKKMKKVPCFIGFFSNWAINWSDLLFSRDHSASICLDSSARQTAGRELEVGVKFCYLKVFAELASDTLKQVADWFVWLTSTLGRFNADELRRADNVVHEIAHDR